jgi:hypothetical protein
MITLFISHASEDKNDFVRPLVKELEFDTNYKVWFDEYMLNWGDSLRQEIDKGLKNCDYGIVVLSKHFFAKNWPKAELDALFTLEQNKHKIILPIWKDVTKEEVASFSPLIAGRFAISAEVGIPNIVKALKQTVTSTERYIEISQPMWKDKFATINANIIHRKAAEGKGRTEEGVREVKINACEIISKARKRAEELSSFQLRIKEGANQEIVFLTLMGPFNISLHISFESPILNSVDSCKLCLSFFRNTHTSGSETFEENNFEPKFDQHLKVYWKGDNDYFFYTSEEFLDYCFDRFADLISEHIEQR